VTREEAITADDAARDAAYAVPPIRQVSARGKIVFANGIKCRIEVEREM